MRCCMWVNICAIPHTKRSSDGKLSLKSIGKVSNQRQCDRISDVVGGG